MPKRVSPELPTAVRDAVTAFALPLRVEILHFLHTRGPATRGGIADSLGASAKTIQTHLSVLTGLGALVADPPLATALSGQRISYRDDPVRVEQLHTALAKYVTGSD